MSEPVAQIVLKAMAKDPADRFQSCAEFLAAIDAIRAAGQTPMAVIVALVAAIVASVGIIAYLSTRSPVIVKSDPSPGTGQSTPGGPFEDEEARKAELERQRIAVQHESAYNVIQTGSEKAAFTCTQLQLRARKQAGLKVAQTIQDTSIEEGLRAQIEEHSRNIDRAIKEYATFLDQLGPLEPSIVTEEFDRVRQGSARRTSRFSRSRSRRTMKRHYEARRRGGGPLDERVMGSECDAAVGKGA